MKKPENPHSKNIEEILKVLNTDIKGISTREAKRRLQIYGKNELEERKEKLYIVFLRQFNNPLVFILIAAAAITAIIGNFLDAGIITGLK